MARTEQCRRRKRERGAKKRERIRVVEAFAQGLQEQRCANAIHAHALADTDTALASLRCSERLAAARDRCPEASRVSWPCTSLGERLARKGAKRSLAAGHVQFCRTNPGACMHGPPPLAAQGHLDRPPLTISSTYLTQELVAIIALGSGTEIVRIRDDVFYHLHAAQMAQRVTRP